MGSLIDEVAKAMGPNSCGNSCSSSGGYAGCRPQYHSPAEEGSLLGDTSVVMGDISTHGGSGVDSSSADTPLSYSLLNYNQNLERYFQSQPKMMPSDGMWSIVPLLFPSHRFSRVSLDEKQDRARAAAPARSTPSRAKSARPT